VRARSDKTEIRRLRAALGRIAELLDGALAADETHQCWINYSRQIATDAIAPKRRPRARASSPGTAEP
jgi:hypothetical protein